MSLLEIGLSLGSVGVPECAFCTEMLAKGLSFCLQCYYRLKYCIIYSPHCWDKIPHKKSKFGKEDLFLFGSHFQECRLSWQGGCSKRTWDWSHCQEAEWMLVLSSFFFKLNPEQQTVVWWCLLLGCVFLPHSKQSSTPFRDNLRVFFS